jgi:hypothetical protein
MAAEYSQRYKRGETQMMQRLHGSSAYRILELVGADTMLKYREMSGQDVLRITAGF